MRLVDLLRFMRELCEVEWKKKKISLYCNEGDMRGDHKYKVE